MTVEQKTELELDLDLASELELEPLPDQLPATPGAELPAVQPTPGTSIVDMIGQAAVDPRFDMDRLRELLALRKEILADEAQEAYIQAMARVQANIGTIVKNKSNEQTHSKYSDLSAINAVLVPVYSKEGFSLSFSTTPSQLEGHLDIHCDVMHVAGHVQRYSYPLPFDGTGIAGKVNKTAIHASGSTVSYGRRYLTLMIFNIATQDDDGQAASAPLFPPITRETLKAIVHGIVITKANTDDTLAFVNHTYGTQYTQLDEMTEQQGSVVLFKLNEKARKIREFGSAGD